MTTIPVHRPTPLHARAVFRSVSLTLSPMADHRYRVIKRLEAGGMAEVYLGEATGVEGFKKRVAIKRVLPHLAQNENFIRMFLDEARLSARLNHANIVSVFDISAREDTYFLIMEFVDGVNLKRIMETLIRREQRVRLPDAIYIGIEACRGLSYAHALADDNGVPLSIVHRDISPPNIMITRRGEVKLADFGLAKASTQIQTTDPGVVKGKFSYLAPEAANGLQVDARADLFALGIVLWEMLAGKRLFWGENDYATVKLIQQANIPRLAPLNREVDEAFEEVLLRALARDPERRYQTAREFGDALSDYLFRNQMMVTAYDLASLVQAALAEDPAAAGDISLIDRLIQEELDESVGISADSGSLPKQTGSGEMSLGAGESYEDPASWFNDDKDLAGGRATAQAGPTQPGAAQSGAAQSGSWRESGVPPAPSPVAPKASRPQAPSPRASAAVDAPEELRVSEVADVTSAPPPKAGPPALPNKAASASKAGGIVYTLIALAVLALAALAWLISKR